MVRLYLLLEVSKTSFDTTSKTLVWDIGHLETRSYPTLKGSVSFKINLLLAVISSVSVVKFVADRTEPRLFSLECADNSSQREHPSLNDAHSESPVRIATDTRLGTARCQVGTAL